MTASNTSPAAALSPTVADEWRWPRRLAFACLLLGLVVRCRQYLARPSYWYDEAYLLLNVFERSYQDLVGALDYQVVIPPAFLWICRAVYQSIGGGEWSMRLPAFGADLAALAVMAPLARHYVASWAWICPLALLAVSKHAVLLSCQVRPYSTDVLVAEALLLATWFALKRQAGSRSSAWGFAALLFGAVVGPWLSFPSVFVLGGASLALLIDAFRDRRAKGWFRWALLNAALLASALALWYFDARHLYYGGLREHWEGWEGFPPQDSFAAATTWCLGRLPSIAEYATAGMGWPLAILAVWAIVALGRRSPAPIVALSAPLVLAFVAAMVRRYPIADRTIFFAAPCVWLLAAAGLADLLRRLPDKGQWPRLAALAILLAPCLSHTLKSLIKVESMADYRAAFDHVHAHWRPGDALWVLHPEVYQVYFGKERRPMGYDTLPAVVEQRALGGRLWTVTVPEHPNVVYCAELFQHLRSDAYLTLDKHPVDGLEAVLYVPTRR